VRLTSCPGIGSPVALGSSEICLPERAGRDLSMGELEALMAHELAHLERRDSIWLTTIHVLERVLFPQPLNRVVRRRLQSDVEILCDDSAASRLGEPADLARCLARVAGWMEGSPAPALATGMAHAPSQLVARVERLLAPRREPRRGAGALAALGMGLALTAIGLGGPGVAAPPAPAKQDTPAHARLLRVEASMRTVAQRPVLHYRLGDFETTDLERLGAHLSRLHTRHPEARIAVASEVGAELLSGLVGQIFERFDSILVEGEGPEQEALREQVVRRRPLRLNLIVIREGRRLDPETGLPWKGEGRYTYDDSRLLEYGIGERRIRALGELQRILRQEHSAHPDGRVRIDVGSGSIYADVTPALDAVIEAGFTDIDFVGAYQNSAISAVIEPEEEPVEEVEEPELIEEVEPEEIFEEWVPTLELDTEGRIRADGNLLRDPLEPKETWSELRTWLAMVAAGMEKVPAKTGPKGLLLPDEQLLISADSQTTFRHVQKVMEFCGAHDVQIWKIELAAPDAGVEQVPIWLPTDPGVVGEQPPIPSVTIRVLKDATADGRLEYTIGPWKTTQLKALRSTLARLRPRSSDLRLVIDPRNGTTVMEVLHLLQMVRGEGYGPISFVGAYPEEVR
jgi:biopolymer transport protein ExbD